MSFTPQALYTGLSEFYTYSRWPKSMAQSLSQIYLHIIFSTKNREAFLQEEGFRSQCHAYLAGVAKNVSAPAIRVGGVEDHVHILCRMSRTLSVADLVREFKQESSKWVKQQQAGSDRFYWQKGYGAFSVSPSHVPWLVAYIEHQEEHHRSETFQGEFRRICKKYGVELDERYAWD